MVAQKPSGAVDFDYLEGYAAGDLSVVREVLALFLQQAASWVKSLNLSGPGWRDTVHTIKGAARGVGAHRLGDLCAEAEARAEPDLTAVTLALEAAVADIAAYQARA